MNYKYRTWINLQELLKLLFVSELCEAKLVMSKLSHLRQFRIQINGRLVLSPNTHHLHPLPWQWNWKQIFVAQNSIYLFHCFVCWPFGETENINFDWSDTFDQYCHYNWWTQSSGPGHWAGRTATIAHSLQQILSTDTLIFIHWIYLQNGENEGKQIMCINRFCLMRTLSKCWKYKQIMSINECCVTWEVELLPLPHHQISYWNVVCCIWNIWLPNLSRQQAGGKTVVHTRTDKNSSLNWKSFLFSHFYSTCFASVFTNDIEYEGKGTKLYGGRYNVE